jgi:hypothetical protein
MIIQRSFLSDYEATKQCSLTRDEIRQLVDDGRINGRKAMLSRRSSIWLVDMKSLNKFLAADYQRRGIHHH